MESIWSKTAELPRREPLPGDLSTKVAVIGGGMAGILTAWFLKERGIEAVVLEADRVGSGQTKNTTAKITAQHGLVYHRLAESGGEEFARQYAAANRRAVEEFARLVKALSISCQFETMPAFLYTTEDPDPLRKEAEAAARLGFEAAYTTMTTLPFPVRGAMRMEGQAQFQPLDFLKAVAREVTVYEDTKALTVEDHRIETNRGVVTADKVVFATHFPFVNMPGFYFVRMHQERSYVLALKHAAELDGMYLGVDEAALSFRNFGEYLLVGGGDHRTGENRAGHRYEMLRKVADQYWPQCREAAHWSAQDCMTHDQLPLIGQFSPSTPDWYVATGFQKWGMTGSMVSARILSAMIAGETPEDAEVFSPQRSNPSLSSAKQLLDEGLHAVRDLSRQVLAPPRGDIDALPEGHGGVVDCGGEKVGVYKDEKGEVFIVSTRCPHLGCQLEWNPDEKSWDCPCHGSRFDYHGKLIDNPAQEDLSHA